MVNMHKMINYLEIINILYAQLKYKAVKIIVAFDIERGRIITLNL